MPRTKNNKRQMMAVMICLLFLLSTIVGAILANGLSLDDISAMQGNIDEIFQSQQPEKNFLSIFCRYRELRERGF